MNLKTINIIIKREYLNRVKKKSFLVTTFVVPILMAAVCIVPILVMLNSKEKTKTIAVVDQSGIVMPFMNNSETVVFKDCSSKTPEAAKASMEADGFDAVLSISALNEAEKTVTAELTSLKPFGMDMTSGIKNRINDAVESYRIDSYEIEGLDQIMQDVKADVKLRSFTMDEEGKETISESGVYSILSMIMGLVIFMFITMFGGMVMSAVIEEKTSRVVEVLVSSVKATDLMFGKIIGVALVALTQFFLWIALTAAIVTTVSGVIGKSLLSDGALDPSSIESMTQSVGVSAGEMPDLASLAAEDSELSVVLSTVKSLPVAKFAFVFVVFFVFGYMLYASLFAAIGSAVENEGDTQQLQLPVTIPLMLGYFIAIYAFNAPDSAITFWGSMIPFTSPIVMLARIPFGVANWEIALSMALLIATFIGCAWVSAKIYKVGILMFGKKSTFKDLWKWLRQN